MATLTPDASPDGNLGSTPGAKMRWQSDQWVRGQQRSASGKSDAIRKRWRWQNVAKAHSSTSFDASLAPGCRHSDEIAVETICICRTLHLRNRSYSRNRRPSQLPPSAITTGSWCCGSACRGPAFSLLAWPVDALGTTTTAPRNRNPPHATNGLPPRRSSPPYSSRLVRADIVISARPAP
ncbi:hypothetical protein SNOG_13849 [Parastagonospora nodorum SN15]|uniref:Uncharacterized protein n=1 Tax=Phaeosphaeria nodorum (strain SN15 / ATCC MYA-4574 / FGSC 10173) TaxID=321614 RepID=Q0U315_PHANO|nr:hypothetical protein SNOG_13849 [Parastagonospora nodorum SN15]EAT78873.1 hypothetical protein SNOG_13849 [Parastagonospora nodorum SN15]